MAWIKRNQIVTVHEVPAKVNLGSGLSVAPGWINLDGSLNALLSGWPKPVLKRLYAYSDSRQWYSSDQYLHILKSHRFVFHRLEYGLPFEDNAVDYIYSSHMLEHVFREEARTLLKDVHRVLKKGGWIRLAVPDLATAINLYQTGQKLKALDYFFTPSSSGAMNCHRYMYDLELLRQLLESAGFVNVTQCSLQVGKVPDIGLLDNRPEETLFVEAVK